MIPQKKQFETVKVDEWINGEITDIKYEMEHQFKKSMNPGVQIKLTLAGYKFPKTTPWMIFSYFKSSGLYKNFILPLVEGAAPDRRFDLDVLKSLKIKVMYEQNGEYQNIKMVRPIGGKILVNFVDESKPSELAEVAESVDEEPIPF